MKFHLAVLLALLLTCPLAFSEEICELPTQPDMTVKQFVEAQVSKSPHAFVVPGSEPNKCFPQEKTAVIIGRPVCYLSYPNALIPVNGVAASSIQDSGSLDVVLYMMRGTKPDFDSALAYFNKEYVDATDEYLRNMKGPRFYGTTHAWKNGEQY